MRFFRSAGVYLPTCGLLVGFLQLAAVAVVLVVGGRFQLSPEPEPPKFPSGLRVRRGRVAEGSRPEAHDMPIAMYMVLWCYIQLSAGHRHCPPAPSLLLVHSVHCLRRATGRFGDGEFDGDRSLPIFVTRWNGALRGGGSFWWAL